MCRYFENFWDDTQRLNLRSLTPPKKQQTEFPRFDAWRKREPPRSSRRKCQCGADDKWRCFIRTQGGQLMGERRK